jgi:type IV secretory pathway VirB9-like protein
MPDAVNSVVLGDPESFSAEHSEREPQIVFVKPISPDPAQTNLLISTARGYQANLLLISRGETRGSQARVDFVLRYRPAGRFIIGPSTPSVSVAQTAALSAQDAMPVPADATEARLREASVTGRADEVRAVASSSREQSLQRAVARRRAAIHLPISTCCWSAKGKRHCRSCTARGPGSRGRESRCSKRE